MRLRSLVLVAVLTALTAPPAAAGPGGATAGAPTDYTRVTGLSAPRFEDIVTETHMLEMRDGVRVYLEVTRPRRGRSPVIATISPYHGTLQQRDGARMLPKQGGLVDYFAPRGYAVLMMDLRGTGRSQGCLDHLGPRDRGDIKTVIEWAASQRWSNGRVGTIGHSYVGATSAMAVSQRPRGLATAVVSAGLASMYHHQFQAGVPYFLQWVGPMEGYEELALERHLPGGDNFGNDMQYFGCGLPQSSLVAGEAQLAGQYVGWHRERDFRKQAAAAPVPVFLVHGVNDNAARIPAIDWFLRRNGRVRTAQGALVRDKVWIGQWDHGSGCCPTRRDYQWTRALHAWFDRHLAGRPVDTGPPVELFLADAGEQEAIAGARTEIFTANRYPGRPRMVAFYPDGDGSLSTLRPFTSDRVSFSGDPSGVFGRALTGGLTFRTDPFERDVLLAGLPKLRLAASVSTPRVHLIANLLQEDPDGVWRRISQFAINPELREGIATRSLVVPGQRYELHPPGWPMAHKIPKGHRLVLRVTTSDPDKVPVFAADPRVTVFTGVSHTRLEVPVVDRPVLYPDVAKLEPPAGR